MWTINLFIAIEKGNERREKNFSAGNTYQTKNKAICHCIDFGRQIIDEQIENCTVADL